MQKKATVGVESSVARPVVRIRYWWDPWSLLPPMSEKTHRRVCNTLMVIAAAILLTWVVGGFLFE